MNRVDRHPSARRSALALATVGVYVAAIALIALAVAGLTTLLMR